MKIKRSGSAVWTGGLKDGKGAISTQMESNLEDVGKLQRGAAFREAEVPMAASSRPERALLLVLLANV